MKTLILVTGLTIFSLPVKAGPQETAPVATVWAVQINVTDIDAAIEFYTSGLGLAVATRDYYPQVVSLENDGGAILLYRVEDRVDYGYNRTVYCNYRVPSLADAVARLKKFTVDFIHDQPQRAAIGTYVGLRDPSGNILHIMELDPQFGRADKSTLLNVGIPITDKDSALAFYGDVLGFQSLGDTYWPPILPFEGNGMALVGHESDSVTPYQYPFKTGTFVILETDALHATCHRLLRAGVSFEYDSPVTHAPVGWYQAVRDPFGNVIEIIQPLDNPFDRARGIERPKAHSAD